MAITTREKALSFIIFLAFCIFPFGQLPGILVQNIFHMSFRLQPLDVLIFLAVVISLRKDFLSKIKIFVPLLSMLVFGMFLSLGSSLFNFMGLFYLLRLIVYVLFLALVGGKIQKTSSHTDFLNILVSLGILIALFGWTQYLFFPDLRYMKYFGWDDHYFRLVSTFLDPAFTGILLALSMLTSLFIWQDRKKNIYLLSSMFLLVTLAFTYSRASYLSFIVGLFFIFWRKSKVAFLSLVLAFLAVIYLLPVSPGGEGVNLARQSSINLKITNYKESIEIIKLSPVFGVGYNNICKAKNFINKDTSKEVNSCSGLDNSYLFILGTTGLIGFFVFLYTCTKLYLKLQKQTKMLFVATLGAVAIHSLFTNTLFYPWVMLWLIILFTKSSKA